MVRSWLRALCAAALAGHAAVSARAQNAANPVALDNEYVRVSRDTAPCAQASTGRCEDRVIVAMGDLELVAGDATRPMKRGHVAIFKAGESYQPPTGGPYYEVAIKPGYPPVKGPPELIPAPKNLLVFDGPRFFIYEERLAPGDTRERHSHSQRVEIRLHQGPVLHQWVWRDGGVAESEPGMVSWREPIIHVVKNVGDIPLRNFILEFIPDRRE
jgi:hypothetical protein